MQNYNATADIIKARSKGINPKIGVILGSGLGDFADQVEDRVVIPYDDLPGFPATGVAGHAGQLVLGRVNGSDVAVMQGRAHFYENAQADIMAAPVRILNAIGCETLFLTNAAGSLIKEAGPGSVVMLRDHINFVGVSPLFGIEDNSRFVDLSDAYAPELQAMLQQSAKDQDIKLYDGVYMWFCGPHFETPAEIKMAGIMGADVVGMSTVPEVILARHAGMKVAAMSIITNHAAGLSNESLSHEHTMQNAGIAAAKAIKILNGFMGLYAAGDK